MTRIWTRSVIVALLSSAPIILAAETSPDPSTDKSPARELVNLTFSGGTIADYLDTLQKTAGDRINIVVSDPRAGQPRFPAVTLRNVDVNSAVNLIASDYRREDGTEIQVAVESVGRFGRTVGKPLYRVSSRVTGQRNMKQFVKVWTLSEVIDERITAEDALTAVELAVSLADKASGPADVRFHEATSLLVARGTPRQIDAINEVIKQLLKGQHQRRQAEADEKGFNDFKGWIEEMRKSDESQRAKGQEPTSRESQLLRDLEHLTHLVDEQTMEIRKLKKQVEPTQRQ